MLAEQDVIETALYLADDSVAAASRFLSAVEGTTRTLLAMPGLGRARLVESPALAGTRSRAVQGFASFVIFYRPVDQGIEVLRVLHGARDLDAIFEGDEAS